MIGDAEGNGHFQRFAQIAFVHLDQRFEQRRTFLSMIVQQFPSSERSFRWTIEPSSYSGMKLTISRATFSQFTFDAQKTKHESFGITSETETFVSFLRGKNRRFRLFTETNESIGIAEQMLFRVLKNETRRRTRTMQRRRTNFEIQTTMFDELTRPVVLVPFDFINDLVDFHVFFQFDLREPARRSSPLVVRRFLSPVETVPRKIARREISADRRY